jgi:nitrite reductase/ring-hydroxylating ferredoxin subunit
VLTRTPKDTKECPEGRQPQPTRRRVLARIWGLTGWSLVAGSGVLLHRTLTAAHPPRRSVSLPPTLLSQARAEGGLATGELFLRYRGDEPTALRLRCTHLGCSLTFDRRAGVLRCPCHGSHFDLDGNPASGPAEIPLEPVALHHRDGTWEAQLDEPLGSG